MPSSKEGVGVEGSANGHRQFALLSGNERNTDHRCAIITAVAEAHT